MKVAINTNTNGRYRNERVNDRDHVVTTMVAIVGDSIMNSGLYPDEEVTASFEQLNQLPAPNGHPKFDGASISAFHPLAVNANNIGAFIANPQKDGKYVINELWVDEEIANQSDDGKELIDRIRTGKQVGVSTGLELVQIASNGEFDGKPYDWTGRNFKFDHVAILLNEKPAGDETFLLNEDGSLADHADTFIVNAEVENEFSVHSTKEQLSELLRAIFPDPFLWIVDCVVEDGDGGKVIYEVEDAMFSRGFSVDDDGLVSIEDESVPVRKKVEFIELANADNSIKPEIEMDKDDDQVPAEITVESAIEFLEGKGMVVNSKQQDDEVQFFTENKDKITALLASEDSRLDVMRKGIVENSELTEEDVADMGESMLVRLAGSFKTNDYGTKGGGVNVDQDNDGGEHLDSYAPDYDAKPEVH